MRLKKSVLTALFVAMGVVAAAMPTPIASADTCDPSVTVCSGGDAQADSSSSPDYSPPASSADEQYPYDSDWYFNPAGGGTDLQPEHPASTGGGGGGAPSGGGGGHR
jgi:hypothetical protein